MNQWYVYMIEASDSSLYTGITTDVTRRWREHCGISKGKNKGAKFFRGRQPQKLVFVQQADNRSEASQVEAQIKKVTRAEKLKLINSSANQQSQFSSELMRLTD